jgi:ABC-2 type transport system permease protein
MANVALAIHQFRYDVRIFWRSPASVFFTVMLPLIFLVIFNGLFGSDTIESLGDLPVSVYYVPGIVTLAIVSATTQSLAMNLTDDREAGRLKRFRATPLPSWAFVAGRVGNSMVTCVVMVAIVTLIGHVFYDVPLPGETIPALLVTLFVGAFCFSCIGFALCAVMPSEEASAPIANATLLPLYFVSGVFVPESEIPDGVLTVAGIFPVRHFFEAFLSAYDPATVGSGFEWADLAVVAAWGIAALLFAARFFSWSPRHA